MQRTENLGLPQFDLKDVYMIEDFNEAYNKIDAKAKELDDKANELDIKTKEIDDKTKELNNKTKELDDKSAELTSKIAEAQVIIDTWTEFKNNGGTINGDIKLPRGFAICGTANGNRDPLIYQSPHADDNGRVIVGSSGQTTQIASELRPEVYWNLQTHEIVLNSDFAGNKNTNGYTKLPNGLIMQWGQYISTTINNSADSPVNFPISFPNECLAMTYGSFFRDDNGNVGIGGSRLYGASKDSFTFRHWAYQDARPVTQCVINWMAIGY